MKPWMAVVAVALLVMVDPVRAAPYLTADPYPPETVDASGVRQLQPDAFQVFVCPGKVTSCTQNGTTGHIAKNPNGADVALLFDLADYNTGSTYTVQVKAQKTDAALGLVQSEPSVPFVYTASARVNAVSGGRVIVSPADLWQ